jgi:SAM-dependent methyltransferase
MHADPLIAQYEQWVYPEPIADLNAYVAAGGRDYSDPSRLPWKIWPRGDVPAGLRILVAGCGANQAAILARSNPLASVLGIDLSGQAIAHHARLKSAHKLHNLDLLRLAVEDVATLGREFDYIVSTGVLHHLADPAAGLGALRQVLAPQGAISVMLYGTHRRAGVYLVQEALRRLGAERTPAGVLLARDVLDRLPGWHAARRYMDVAPDLGYDSGVVDTFLNARDRAYTIPEIMALAASVGLRFQSWLDGLHYSPSAVFPADAAIHDHIHDLPQVEQWHIVDLLGQVSGAHRFLLCHGGREPVPSGIDADAIPHRHPELVVAEERGSITLRREWHTLRLDGVALAAFRRIDGSRSFRLILDAFADRGSRDYVAEVFRHLAECDHIHFTYPRTSPW